MDATFEYIAGFLFGLLIFQALFTKIIMGGSYASAVRRTLLPEWLSMNVLMGGMLPVMSILMRQDPIAMHPGGLRFWGVMSAAILVGTVAAYPVNVWLVANGPKHGMGSSAVLGRGGEAVGRHTAPRRTASRAETAAMSFGTVVALALGLLLAVRFGNLG